MIKSKLNIKYNLSLIVVSSFVLLVESYVVNHNEFRNVDWNKYANNHLKREKNFEKKFVHGHEAREKIIKRNDDENEKEDEIHDENGKKNRTTTITTTLEPSLSKKNFGFPSSTKPTKKRHRKIDYEKIFPEYSFEIEEVKKNFTLDIPEDEVERYRNSYLENLFTYKRPENCSEMRGIGIKSLHCVFIELKTSKNNNERKAVFKRFKRIIKIWFIIYLIVAVPCWCVKGWCCCCFFCDFFHPERRIKKSKDFFVDNPPGVFNYKGETYRYEPDDEELIIYKEFEKTLLSIW